MDRNELVQCPLVRDIIRHKARRMIQSGGYSRSDQEDLEHDLIVALLQAWSRYDAARGEPLAFVVAVTLRAAAAAVRRRRRQMPREQIARDLQQQRFERYAGEHDSERASDIEMDCASVARSFPPELRALVERLSEGAIADVVRDLKVPRSTLQRRIHKVRQRFQRGALDQYR